VTTTGNVPVGEYETRDGNIGKMILLVAIDPEVPREQRPKLTTVTPPPREPPPPKRNGSTRDDMDQ
jgi:hypothetical protein